jgi:hypothetical protein
MIVLSLILLLINATAHTSYLLRYLILIFWDVYQNIFKFSFPFFIWFVSSLGLNSFRFFFNSPITTCSNPFVLL